MHYDIRFPHPETHVYELTLTVTGTNQGAHQLEMAVWTPGSYLVREFEGHVHRVRAEGLGGEPLRVRKIRKNIWQVETAETGFRFLYEVYANELTVDTSHLDATHAYWNGASLFLALDGRKELPYTIDVQVPSGWRASTGLEIESQDEAGHIRFFAPDYDTLLDGPVEIGTHRSYHFEVGGKDHELAIWGHGNEDPGRLTRDLTRIVETAAEIFGGLPYSRYVFLLHLTDHRGGGLEHKNSTTCQTDRFSFRPEAIYLRLLSLFSHEFFHLWNVKRIHPLALGPFDYGSENHTTLLWAMEGITDYYADLILERAGLWSSRKFRQMLAQQIRIYENTPGRYVQTVAESSYDTWVKFYRRNESSPNFTISYYLKGYLVGLSLDLEIRHRTGGTRGLDDVLRALWEAYGRHDRGFPEEAYRTVAEEVAGGSLAAFWQKHIDGVEELDLGAFLRYAGLALTRRISRDERLSDPANRPDPEPGAPSEGEGSDAEEGIEGEPRSALGVILETRKGRIKADVVLADQSAYEAGVNAGDELLAVNGYQIVSDAFLRERLSEYAPGTEIRLTVNRAGMILTLPVLLREAPKDDYRLELTEADAGERNVYETWLGRPYPGGKRGPSSAARIQDPLPSV